MVQDDVALKVEGQLFSRPLQRGLSRRGSLGMMRHMGLPGAWGQGERLGTRLRSSFLQ